MGLLVPTAVLTTLLFEEACRSYLESRRGYISIKTFHEYNLNIKTLSKYFGQFHVQEIDGDLLRMYQRDRQKQCGPHAINHETGFFLQVRKRIGMPLVDYQPLPLPKELRGQAISDEQKARLLRMARANPNWYAAYLFAIISVNTSAGPRETFTLRLCDIDIDRATMRVQPGGAKNTYRIRTIPLNAEALLGIQLAIERARELGAVDPKHYLFPFRDGGRYDPTRHQTWFKTAWGKLRVAAGLPTLRMYDLRHTFITELLENPEVSEETIEDIVGHVSHRMKKRYSHIRMEHKRAAVEALIRKKVAKRQPAEEIDPVEKLATVLAKFMTAKQI